MKKEIISLVTAKILKSKNLKSQLLLFGSIIILFIVFAFGTIGFIAYQAASTLWTSENAAKVENFASAGIQKSKSLLDQQQISSPLCLQQISKGLNIDSLLNLGVFIENLKNACLSNTAPKDERQDENPQPELI